jgi:hypothetical protein
MRCDALLVLVGAGFLLARRTVVKSSAAAVDAATLPLGHKIQNKWRVSLNKFFFYD